MNDLDTLRPEVREAISVLDLASKQYYLTARFEVVRSELLRLADECSTLKAQSIYPRAQLLANCAAANERAEKAEAELAALKTKLGASEIGEVVGRGLHGCVLVAGCAYDAVCGKRVALVKVED